MQQESAQVVSISPPLLLRFPEVKRNTLKKPVAPYDRLKPYPAAGYFTIAKTGKAVLAFRWGEHHVRYFFYGKKYHKRARGTDHWIFWGVRSRIKPIDFFNRNFRFNDHPDRTDPTVRKLAARQRCTSCDKMKFVIEFPHNTHKKNIRSKRCISCMAAERGTPQTWPEDPSSLDRSIRANFIKYMQNRPVYFEYVFDMPATDENIFSAYEELTTYREELL